MINSKKMQGVPVRTASGQQVGKLISFDVDADRGRIEALRVRMSRSMPALLNKEAYVSWSQIVSMDEKEIVVRDGVVVERSAVPSNSLAAT